MPPPKEGKTGTSTVQSAVVPSHGQHRGQQLHIFREFVERFIGEQAKAVVGLPVWVGRVDVFTTISFALKAPVQNIVAL